MCVNEKKTSGDVSSFRKAWKEIDPSLYIHWIRGEPANQIQFAFRQLWDLCCQLLGPQGTPRRVLEVGCGRGSLSAYFADSGDQCTLLDLSPEVIERAKRTFEHHELPATFVIGDALALPFQDRSFDVVFSIGLLEHFEDVGQVVREQVRILDSEGWFLGYVVPELPDNVQREYLWVNELLRELVPSDWLSRIQSKPDLYRSAFLSAHYLAEMRKLPLIDIGSSGVYPLPMISYSPEFPFSLLPPPCERLLVRHFSECLEKRRQSSGHHPWLCDEKYGQAFLIWGRKTDVQSSSHKGA